MKLALIIVGVPLLIIAVAMLMPKKPASGTQAVPRQRRRRIARQSGWVLLCILFAGIPASRLVRNTQARDVIIMVSASAGVGYIALAALRLLVANSRTSTWQRQKSVSCVNCGYDLRHSPEICPECAAPAPPVIVIHCDNARTFPQWANILLHCFGLSMHAALELTEELHKVGWVALSEAQAGQAASICEHLKPQGIQTFITSPAELHQHLSQAGGGS